MHLTILDCDSAGPQAGPIFRRRRSGPEADLVAQFLEQMPVSLPPGCHGTVFCEPRLESGFPDLVIVIWDVGTTQRWYPERATLSEGDIRLLHLLHARRRRFQAYDDLKRVFREGLLRRLDRLSAAHLVRERRGAYAALPLADAFAARQIIAIEAKVYNWSAAIDQAFLNTWFSSESYILLPRERSTPELRAAAKSRGVRICWPGRGVMSVASAQLRRIPRSYASWLFNEWSWRFAELKEVKKCYARERFSNNRPRLASEAVSAAFESHPS